MVTTDFLGALNAGSGLNTKNLVESIVAAERAPVENRINSGINSSEAEISAIGLVKADLQTLETAFDALNDQTDFENFSVTTTGGLNSGGADAFSVSADANALAGTHQITVASLAQADRFISAGYDSTGASLNGGSPFVLSFTTGGTTLNEVSVTTASPQGVVDAVNSANIGVTASIVDTGATTSRYKIVFTGTTGATNAFTFETGGTGETGNLVAASNVSTTNDTITITGHGYSTGDIVTYDADGGTVLGGLTDSTAYHVIKVDANTIKLATSASNASSNTQIDLTGTGNDAQIFSGYQAGSSSTVATSNVSTDNNTLTISGHGFLTGDRLTYSAAGGTAITGLTDGTTYFAIRVDDNTIKLATSSANAVAGTQVTFTGAGNNSQTFSGPQPPFVATSSVSSTNDTITMTGHGYVTGDIVTYRANGGTAIAGLTDATAFHVIRVDDNTFKLANSASNATAGTQLDLTGTGNAAQFFTGRGLTFNDRSVSASDASITVDGISITRASNEISDAISGLTIKLFDQTASTGVVSISTDSASVETKLRTLVDTFNKIMTTIDTVSGPDATGDSAGVLSGDNNLRAIERQVKAMFTNISSTPGTSLQYLADAGIEITKLGKLEINETKFATALSSNYLDIRKMFSADTNNQTTIGTASRGFAGDALITLSELLGTTGIVESRTTRETERIAELKTELTELDERMKKVKARYLAQFTAMEQFIDEMNNTRDFLKAQIEALPFNNRDKR